MRTKVKTVVPILAKIAIIIAVTMVLSIWINTLHETAINDLALYQMTNAPDSSSTIYFYSMLMNYLWVVPTVLSLILFLPEIISCTKYIINRHRKDNNHDKNI